MATRRPIVLVSGISSELPVGDVIDTGLDVTLQPNPSGLYFTGDNKLGFDGQGDNIQVIASGVGAVYRTVQDKGRDFISVKDFGAAGDGVQDDTSYIQAALNAANGRPVLIPQGTYKITSSLSIDATGLGVVRGIYIYGEGEDKTVIDNASGSPAFDLTSGTSSSDWLEGLNISDLSVLNSTSSSSTIGLQLSGVRKSTLKNITVKQQTSYGLYFISTTGDATDCFKITVENCTFESNGGDGVRVYGGPNAIHSSLKFINCRVGLNSATGISFYSAVQCSVENCAIYYNDGTGLVLSVIDGPFSKLNSVISSEFDSNNGIQVDVRNAKDTVLANNYIISNTPGGSVYAVTTGIKCSASGFNSHIQNTNFRLYASASGVTAHYVDSSSSYNTIKYTDWSDWVSSGNTKYSNLSTSSIIVDDNTYLTSLPVASGIHFPATQVSSADPNTLDDYEESTWTTTVSAYTNLDASPTLSDAFYVKIGSLVHIEGSFTGDVTIAGAVSITFNLPFNTVAGSSSACGSVLESNSIVVGGIVDVTGSNPTQAQLWVPNFPGTATGRQFRFSMTYRSAG